MNSHELQEAWNNGTISDDQKVELLNFAHERFDERGHYQDVEGYTSAADMEAEARGISINTAHRQENPVEQAEAPADKAVVEESVVAETPKPVETKQTQSSQKVAAAILDTPEAQADSNILSYTQNDDGTKTLVYTIDRGDTKLEFNITIDDEKILSVSRGNKQMPDDMLEELNKEHASYIIEEAKAYEQQHVQTSTNISQMITQKHGRE
jgi:hypothetical protein